jgi:hypothetical protein
MALGFVSVLLILASDAGVAPSTSENRTGYLPSAAFSDATGRERPAHTLQIELAEAEAVLGNLGVAKLRRPGVPDQIRCTLLPVQERGRSATLMGMTTTPLVAGVVGTLSTNYQLGGVVKATEPRPLERSVADLVRRQVLEDGQCLKKPGDRTGLKPPPPGEFIFLADSRFLLVEVVDSGRYAFCRIWANGASLPTLTPLLDEPLRKACATLFSAAGLDA